MKIYRSIRTKTMLHFDNSGKYGQDFKEIQIVYRNKMFRAYITDGFKYQNAGEFFDSLKDAVKWGKQELEVKL